MIHKKIVYVDSLGLHRILTVVSMEDIDMLTVASKQHMLAIQSYGEFIDLVSYSPLCKKKINK